jgi:hypothetical protein
VDNPWTAPTVPGVDFLLFTDDAALRAPGWRTVICSPAFDDPRKSAKIFKVLPHRYLASYQVSVWVDGTTCPRQDPRPWIDSVLKSGIATFVHPERDCIYDEARICVDRGFDRDVIEAQMARYRDAGYPAHHGLNTCTVIVREHNAPYVVAAMEEWWREIEQGSIRDQLSFNFVLWNRGLVSDIIPGHVYWNSMFRYAPHGVRSNKLIAYVESKRARPNLLWSAILTAKDAVGRFIEELRSS